MKAVGITAHALTANSMLIRVHIGNLVFAPMYFYSFNDNVANMDVTRKRSNCKKANMSNIVLYIL